MADLFKFRSFTVQQRDNVMKIGTDGVLLGALVDAKNAKSVLDVGSGTGVISLMIAQRCSAKITGIEVDESSFYECKHNFENSPWNERLKAVNIDYIQYRSEAKFDFIVSNPPYFENTSPSNNVARNRVRQQSSLSHSAFLEKSIDLLKDNGNLCLILPIQAFEAFTRMAESHGLFLCERWDIFGKKGKSITRKIGRFSKQKSDLISHTLTIELDQRHQYSAEYLRLMRDYLFLERDS